MQRLGLAISLGLLLPFGACAGEGSVGGSRPGQQPGDAIVMGDGESQLPPNPTARRSGPLPDGGAASCAERYAPAALAGRAFAFDGVVLAIGRSVSDRGDGGDLGLPGVTFEVREWLSGGRADTVTVDMQPPTTGPADTSQPGYAYGIGSRLLVSGEARWGGSSLKAPVAWGCGFTRYYTPRAAAAWRDALAR